MHFFSGTADWSNLPRDVWMQIAQKFTFRDLSSFASVCAQWRDVAREARGSFLSRPPLLLLPSNEGTHVRDFYDLSTNSVCSVNLPELDDLWICGASNGWLVTLDVNLNIELFNPYSKTKLQLPHHPAIGDYRHRIYRTCRSCYMQKVVLTGSPSLDQACFVASIVSNRRRLALCRVGDDQWTDVDTEPNRYVDVTCYKGKLFAIRECGPLVVLDVGQDFKINTINAPPDGPPTMSGLMGNGSVCQKYLVESAGDLLVVLRFSSSSANGCKTYQFHVYKLSESVHGWTKVENLGDQSIFVGVNHSISARACGLDGCKANCIYYLEDLVLHRDEKGFQFDCGLFCLEDGCTETLPEEVLSFWSKPGVWCMQSL